MQVLSSNQVEQTIEAKPSRLKLLKSNADFLALALVIGGFLFVAAQRLETSPVPHVDESYMLQTSYEMIYRGKLALPLRQLLDSGYTEYWHSLTPVHYILQSAFLKLAGWGVFEGRIFNLITATLFLIMIYLIGRKLFGWRVGLIAVVMLVCDITFLERSRLLRNDYSASMFALLAYFLCELAERRKTWWPYIACGMAAGAAVMCHTSALYMLGAIPLLMLFRHGWRLFKTARLYQYIAGAFAVMGYELINDLIHLQTLITQNSGDNRHFEILAPMGWWKNIRHEYRRYYQWYVGDLMYSDVPRMLLHLFQLLAIAAIIYLIIRFALYVKRGNLMSEARVRILFVAVFSVLFFAVIASQKGIYYMAHLTPWFALAVGILLADGLDGVKRLRTAAWKLWPPPKLVYRAAIAAVAVFLIAFSYHALKQNYRYLRAARNPDNATFEEFKQVLRSVVPEGVCPMAIREPVLWLAFPEYDYCFANVQERMRKAVDVEGKEYAVIVDPNIMRPWLKRKIQQSGHLLGELRNTPYGDFNVYYTGTDPRWLALTARRYQFFGIERGHVSDEQVAQAREAWSAGTADLSRFVGVSDSATETEAVSIIPGKSARADGIIELCSIELEPEMIYQLSVDASAQAGKWALVIIDERTGAWLIDKRIGDEDGGKKNGHRGIEGLFKTSWSSHVKIGALPLNQGATEALRISRISISEVAPITPAN